MRFWTAVCTLYAGSDGESLDFFVVNFSHGYVDVELDSEERGSGFVGGSGGV